MSLATRCTACGTVFRVVEDQLKVSEGWVRCGRCQQVFNAVESLFDLEREAPPPWTPPVAAAGPAAASVQATSAAAAKAPAAPAGTSPAPKSAAEVAYAEYSQDPAADSAPVDLLLNLNVETPPTNPTPGSLFNALIDHHPPYSDSVSTGDVDIDIDAIPDNVRVEDVDLDIDAENDIDVDIEALAASVGASTALVDIVLDDSPATAAIAAQQFGSSAPYLMREAAPLPPQAGTSATAFDGTDTDAEAAAPSFVTQAEREARWRRSPLRLSYAVAGLLLTLVLLLQIGMHFRDALAAGWPEARATLAGLCALGGCKLEAPRRIDSITVESSGLTRNADNSGYKLSVVLNNRAAYALAIPSIDLSLTDGDGQVMSRRVLHPADFKPANEALKASGVTTLELTMTASTKPIAGYTVEIFYP